MPPKNAANTSGSDELDDVLTRRRLKTMESETDAPHASTASCRQPQGIPSREEQKSIPKITGLSKKSASATSSAKNDKQYAEFEGDKLGQGKSTAGNKLLGIDGSYKPKIKEWTFVKVLPNSAKCFQKGTCIRVLDVPGFGDSRLQEHLTTIEVNARFVNAIMEVQEKMDITYHRILYFLPFRGTPNRVDAYLQDELKLLFHYFGKSIFQCMVIIATQEDCYQQCPFESKRIDSLTELIKTALQKTTGQAMDTKCPPVVYFPINSSPDDILNQIQTANVVNDCSVLTARQSVPMYKGEDHWEEWIGKFEAIANDQFKDDDKAKLLFFKGRLADNVKSMCLVGCLPTDDYRMVKQKVEEKLYSEVFCYKDIPEPYSGEGDETYWEQWIEHFEKRASQKKLDDRRKLQWLQARLVRGAQETVSKLSSNERQSFALVKKALKKQVYATCLEKRGKKSSEEIGDYAKSLLRLATYAYPDAPEQEREGKVLSYLKPYLHSSIQSRKWKTVEEAIIVNSAVITVDEQFTNDRSEGWDKWLKEFENKCKGSCLDQSKYLLWFESQLGGRAVECYNTLSEQLRENYEVAKDNFEAKLYQNSFADKCKTKPPKGCVNDWAMKLSELIYRKRGKTGWESYTKDLCSLGERVYPKEKSKQMVLEHILTLVHEPPKSKRWTSLDEAVNALMAEEVLPLFSNAEEDNWKVWKPRFQREITKRALDNEKKLAWLSSRLGGDAKQAFDELHCTDYDTALNTLEKKLYMRRFESRTKKPSETWEQLHNHLRSLAADCYSSASDIECAVFKQICSIMKRNGTDLCVDPLSAEDAVLIVSAKCQFQIPSLEQKTGRHG
eukprot:Em0007g105a